MSAAIKYCLLQITLRDRRNGFFFLRVKAVINNRRKSNCRQPVAAI